jgi:hypothetical protein
MPKIEVGAFFKPYNIALGFKFRNPKYTALILSFEQKLYLSKFCPYWGRFHVVLDMIASFHVMSWWLAFLHVDPK